MKNGQELQQSATTETQPQEYVVGYGMAEQLHAGTPAIGEEQLTEARRILEEYKNGKQNLEQKIVNNEQFWKLRHWEMAKEPEHQQTPATAWLWNLIVSKHADLMDGFPEPNILPREPDDKEEARRLSAIVPVVLEQNDFRRTYSRAGYYKGKHGTSIYKVIWDAEKLNGLGDITIRLVDAINLFWEPGITDIQDSRNLFQCELIDNDELKATWPQLTDELLGSDLTVAKYLYDDHVDTTKKSTVVDWYYKKRVGGKTVLHYCKFVGDVVLYATENETTPPTSPLTDPDTGGQAVNPETGHAIAQPVGLPPAQAGLYDHGQYPFVFDVLFEIAGSPFGYGYTDILKPTQISIDQLNAALVKNARMAVRRRYLVSQQCGLNQKDFADWNQELIEVNGSPSEEHVRELTVAPLPGIYVDMLQFQIEQLKETGGNRDVNNGGGQSGVTAASAIAALQEAGNKTSRDMIATTYDAYKQICTQVIELIRQFYDTPRQFRITSEHGEEIFATYDNSDLRPQAQGTEFGIDMGYRVPQFDIKVSAQKATPYSKMAQNELGLQFYNLDLFNPQNATRALALLEMMDFDGKEEIEQRIEQNGTLLDQFRQVMQLALGMASRYDPNMVPMLMQTAQAAGLGGAPGMRVAADPELVETMEDGSLKQEEHAFVRKAREQAQSSTQPR